MLGFQSLGLITAFICIFTPLTIAKTESLLALQFPEPPPQSNTGNGSGTVGGGTRGIASGSPIVPLDNGVTTASENPSLFIWYIPSTTVKEMELILELETEQKIVQILDLPLQNSILELKLPEDITLTPNHSYKWTLKTIHSNLDETKNSIIEGTIKVVSLTARQKQDIRQAQNSLEKAEIYAQFYLWNETLTTMLALRDTEPKQWEELLESINFEVSAEINTASVVTIDLQN